MNNILLNKYATGAVFLSIFMKSAYFLRRYKYIFALFCEFKSMETTAICTDVTIWEQNFIFLHDIPPFVAWFRIMINDTRTES